MRKVIVLGIPLALVLVVLLIQLIPYGHNHVNPPVRQEVKWDSEQTRALAVRACYDCHSDQTDWPWYSNVAPISWLIQKDVDEGRSKLNFTAWDRTYRDARDAPREVQRGTMPQWYYVLLHPSANLNADEKQALIAGLQKTLGSR